MSQAEQKQNQQQKRENCHHWGYSNPEEWAKYYPVGSHQSPINILVSNYDQLIQSTCCTVNNNDGNGNGNGNGNNQNQNNHHNHNHSHTNKHHSHHVISERMASLYLTPVSDHPLNSNGKYTPTSRKVIVQQRVVEHSQQQLMRQHLNSVGDEQQHPRSSSTCSSVFSASGSSCPPSPAQNYDSDGSDSSAFYGSQEINNSNSQNFPMEKRHQQQQQQQQVQRTRYCISNHKIFLGYPRYLSSMQLCNTGHSWQVSLPQELANHTLLSGPPFGEREYRLAQLHCHWGENCQRGSEHLINGQGFAAEIHFVHWNCTDFQSMEEASKHKHGLAVLGVMVEALEGEQYKNKHLDKIVQALKRVEKPGATVEVNARLDLKKLFPANRWNYATYEGSLTTPPLSEVVDWLVFLNPIQCSSAQIEQFRRLKCPSEEEEEETEDEQKMIKNHRPVQPHNGRLVSIWTHH